ncbi:TPA: hypothetical protein ACKPYC_005763 [Pseudomonas aeruginosa]|uniref:Uncharacterized protein n=1 Tax=Pseudomonas aeruginosa TaxID=287 RepID=A0A2R4BG06_PSEAI|nr:MULTISPECIES: hypothetical protein [Pseudomonas]ARG90169.1 hypothetical protein E613_61550 [Pseudomonas aeruginosa]ASD15254.1 hypothetical protein CD799_04750 [Pseudomonas aeruginosa]AUA80056.1 hypothetical protein CWI21_29425 [Pseudomonas aeruginosa]AUB04686.1 hypothetical protein CWI20_29425 [Pseudomonas aeruginosa]AVK00981.1 hypothetical protein CSB94_2220 [Pseudomonas aeruginosa]
MVVGEAWRKVGNYPALTLSGLVAVLPEVIARLTADPAASKVVDWTRCWSGNCGLSAKRKASAKSMTRPSRGIACHSVTGP